MKYRKLLYVICIATCILQMQSLNSFAQSKSPSGSQKDNQVKTKPVTNDKPTSPPSNSTANQTTATEKTAEDCDNIILKNGEEIKAHVVEVGADEIKYKKCSNLNGPTYSIRKPEVFMIQYPNGNKDTFNTNETASPKKSEATPASSDEKKYSGFTNITELGVMSGIGTIKTSAGDISNDQTLFTVSTVNGVLINSNYSIGLGLGYDKYSNADFVPIYLDNRVNFIEGTASPQLIFDIGYTLGKFNGNNQKWDIGGLLIQPGVGVKVFVSSTVAVNFNILYKIQDSKAYFYTYNGSYYYNGIEKVTSNFICIKAGIQF